jgi:hypothetical protein
MNFGEMKKFARFLSGDALDPTQAHFGEETTAMCLNEAASEVAAEAQPNRTYFDSTTIAWNDPSLAPDDPRREGRYGLPSSFVSVKAVHIVHGNRRIQLERMSFDPFEERYQLVTLGAIPEAYRVEFGATDQTASPPGDIWLGPKPNAAYPLRVSLYRLPIPIEATGNDDKVFELPESFHKVVCYAAAAKMALRNDDTSRFNKLMALYADGLYKAQNTVARFDRVGPFGPKTPYSGGQKWYTRRRR